MADEPPLSLLTALASRIRNFEESQEPSLVLGAEAVAEVRLLMEYLAPSSGNRVEMTVETASLLARLHWHRARALSEEGLDGSAELTTALNIFLQLLPVAPDEVPDAVRQRFHARPDEVQPARDANNAAADLMDEYEETGDLGLLEAAETLVRRAAAPEGIERGFCLANLCLVLMRRFEATGDPAVLSESVDVGRAAVDLVEEQGPDRGTALANLGTALHARFRLYGNQADLDEAIGLSRQTVAITSADSPSYPLFLANLASVLRDRFRRTDDLADLDEAVSCNERAFRMAPADYPDKAALASNLSATLLSRFDHTGREADFQAAIDAIREAVHTTDKGNPYRPSRLNNLALVLKKRFERTGRRTDLEDAIEAAEEAVAATPAGHPQLPTLESTLSGLIADRFDLSGDLADLDYAIDAEQRAVHHTPPRSAHRSDFLSDLAGSLQTRFARTGRIEDLDRAIDASREAVDGPGLGSSARARYLNNYALILRLRFEHFGQRSYLDEAVRVSQQAANTPTSLGAHARHWSNLGAVLLERFNYFGVTDDLNAAIQACSSALDSGDLEVADLAHCLSNLGLAFQERSRLSSSDTDLDMAIDLLRRALDTIPDDHVSRRGMQLNHAVGLWMRYRRRRRIADLDAAIAAVRESLDGNRAGDSQYATRLANLGTFLRDRYNVSGEVGDLDEAIDATRAALDLTAADNPDHAHRLTNLGIALRTRFTATEDAAEIDEAIAVGSQAVEETPTGRVDRVGMLSSLGLTLRTRYLHSNREADLEQAIDIGKQAVNAPGNNADRAAGLFNLGIAYYWRYQRRRMPADLEAGIDALRRAAATQTAPARERITAAAAAGRWAAEAGNPAAALGDYTIAVELLPQAAWQGLDRITQQEQLAHWTGLAAEAAACALAAGEPERAVELLEQGRSVLWTHALHLRSDVSQLADQAPDLAARLDAIRRQINTVSLPQDSAVTAPTQLVDSEQLRRRAYRQLDELIEEIRRIPSFENFFKATPFSELHDAAIEGPIVILNASTLGCHALVINHEPGTTGISALPRSRLRVLKLAVTHQEVAQRASLLRTLLNNSHDVERSFTEREQDRHAMFDLLEWLWDTVAEPVMEIVEVPPRPGGTTPESSLRRLWWCPTGLWTLLPVHAAGRYSRTSSRRTREEHTLSSLAVSSYTPTVATLKRARMAASSTNRSIGTREPRRQLAVGLTRTPGLPALNSVSEELQVLAAHFPPPDRARQLTEEKATRANILKSLPDYPWVHFACHGEQNASDPSLSSLAVYDGRITIADLAQVDIRQAELAFLSACSTALVSQLQLLDEAIHLAAAFQLLSYTHVIATMWSILDAPSPSVARTVYDRLVSAAGSDAGRTAEALHEAVVQLRKRAPDHPLIWAPYVHFGP